MKNALLIILILTARLTAFALIAHEWGTFTSFQNGVGSTMYGLHRGDQPLPGFVYLRNPTNLATPTHSITGCRGHSYDCDYAINYEFNPLESSSSQNNLVNQRMETPVIYFYSDTQVNAQVKVDFPKGIITEWFPRESQFSPEIGQVNGIQNGSMSWDVKVMTSRLTLPEVDANSIWNPSRQVSANDIQVINRTSQQVENERLIFYRGVGDFTTPFMAQRNSDQSFSLYVASKSEFPEQSIPSVLYIRVHEGKGYVESLGTLKSPTNFSVPSENLNKPMDEYLNLATNRLVEQLVLNGLYVDEAYAMAHTWKQAYFVTPGERFLYILPRAWTDTLLPLTINPVPEQLTRVLVGRVEVMNGERFNQAYKLISQLAVNQTPMKLINLNYSGFEEQIIRMVSEESKNRETPVTAQTIQLYCQEMIRRIYSR